MGAFYSLITCKMSAQFMQSSCRQAEKLFYNTEDSLVKHLLDKLKLTPDKYIVILYTLSYQVASMNGELIQQ